MASSFRTFSIAKALTRAQSHRSFGTTNALRNEASVNTGTISVQKRPIGGFRGGIVGFLFGFSLASSYAAYHLLEEYQVASAALQASVDELKLSTEKVSAHIRRIEAVERDLKGLAQLSATKDDISRVRAEAKKLHDGLHVGKTFGPSFPRVGNTTRLAFSVEKGLNNASRLIIQSLFVDQVNDRIEFLVGIPFAVLLASFVGLVLHYPNEDVSKTVDYSPRHESLGTQSKN